MNKISKIASEKIRIYFGKSKNRKVWLPLLGVVLLAFPFIVRSEYILNIAVMSGIYVILASSMNLTNGYTGLFSFGHAAFYGIGAYTTGIMTTHLGTGFWVGMVCGMVAATIFGIIVAIPCLKLKGIYLAMMTIAFAEIIRLIIMNTPSFSGGCHGIRNIPPVMIFGIPLITSSQYYYLVLVFIAFTLFIISRVIKSRVGRAFIAIREDELAAQSIGISVTKYKLMSFALGTFFAGIAGVLYAHYTSYICAGSFGLNETIAIMTMMVVGGMGSQIGPVLGAIMLTIIPELFRFIQEYRMMIYGVILILLILFRPSGIVGVKGVAGIKVIIPKFLNRSSKEK